MLNRAYIAEAGRLWNTYAPGSMMDLTPVLFTSKHDFFGDVTSTGAMRALALFSASAPPRTVDSTTTVYIPSPVYFYKEGQLHDPKTGKWADTGKEAVEAAKAAQAKAEKQAKKMAKDAAAKLKSAKQKAKGKSEAQKLAIKKAHYEAYQILHPHGNVPKKAGVPEAIVDTPTTKVSLTITPPKPKPTGEAMTLLSVLSDLDPMSQAYTDQKTDLLDEALLKLDDKNLTDKGKAAKQKLLETASTTLTATTVNPLDPTDPDGPSKAAGYDSLQSEVYQKAKPNFKYMNLDLDGHLASKAKAKMAVIYEMIKEEAQSDNPHLAKQSKLAKLYEVAQEQLAGLTAGTEPQQTVEEKKWLTEFEENPLQLTLQRKELQEVVDQERAVWQMAAEDYGEMSPQAQKSATYVDTLEEKLKFLDKQIAIEDGTVDSTGSALPPYQDHAGAISILSAKIKTKQEEAANLEGKNGPGHPTVAAAVNEVLDLKKQVQDLQDKTAQQHAAQYSPTPEQPFDPFADDPMLKAAKAYSAGWHIGDVAAQYGTDSVEFNEFVQLINQRNGTTYKVEDMAIVVDALLAEMRQIDDLYASGSVPPLLDASSTKRQNEITEKFNAYTYPKGNPKALAPGDKKLAGGMLLSQYQAQEAKKKQYVKDKQAEIEKLDAEVAAQKEPIAYAQTVERKNLEYDLKTAQDLHQKAKAELVIAKSKNPKKLILEAQAERKRLQADNYGTVPDDAVMSRMEELANQVDRIGDIHAMWPENADPPAGSKAEAEINALQAESALAKHLGDKKQVAAILVDLEAAQKNLDHEKMMASITSPDAFQQGFNDLVDEDGTPFDPGRYNMDGTAFRAFYVGKNQTELGGLDKSSLDVHFSDWADSVGDWAEALDSYQGTGHGPINAYLRSGTDPESSVEEFDPEQVPDDWGSNEIEEATQTYEGNQYDTDIQELMNEDPDAPKLDDFVIGPNQWDAPAYDGAVEKWKNDHQSEIEAYALTKLEEYIEEAHKTWYDEAVQQAEEYFNENSDGGSSLPDNVDTLVENLDEAFEHEAAKAPANLIVYRRGLVGQGADLSGVKESGGVGREGQYIEGQVYKDQGYVSTSINPEVSARFYDQWNVIEVAKGANMLWLDAHSARGEEEVLLHREGQYIYLGKKAKHPWPNKYSNRTVDGSPDVEEYVHRWRYVGPDYDPDNPAAGTVDSTPTDAWDPYAVKSDWFAPNDPATGKAKNYDDAALDKLMQIPSVMEWHKKGAAQEKKVKSGKIKLHPSVFSATFGLTSKAPRKLPYARGSAADKHTWKPGDLIDTGKNIFGPDGKPPEKGPGPAPTMPQGDAGGSQRLGTRASGMSTHSFFSPTSQAPTEALVRFERGYAMFYTDLQPRGSGGKWIDTGAGRRHLTDTERRKQERELKRAHLEADTQARKATTAMDRAKREAAIKRVMPSTKPIELITTPTTRLSLTIAPPARPPHVPVKKLSYDEILEMVRGHARIPGDYSLLTDAQNKEMARIEAENLEAVRNDKRDNPQGPKPHYGEAPIEAHPDNELKAQASWDALTEVDKARLVSGSDDYSADAEEKHVNFTTAYKVDEENATQGYIKSYAAKRGMTVQEYVGAAKAHVKTLVDNAQLAKRTHEDTLSRILETGKVHTQFVTGASSGNNDQALRASAENTMFNAPTDLDPAKRAVYGYMRDDLDSQLGPDANLDQYGDVDLIMKSSARSRSTFAGDDSLGLMYPSGDTSNQSPLIWPSPVDRPNLRWYSQMHEDILDIEHIQDLYGAHYVEAQIHEGVGVGDLERVVFRTFDLNPELTKALDDAGIPWSNAGEDRPLDLGLPDDYVPLTDTERVGLGMRPLGDRIVAAPTATYKPWTPPVADEAAVNGYRAQLGEMGINSDFDEDYPVAAKVATEVLQEFSEAGLPLPTYVQSKGANSTIGKGALAQYDAFTGRVLINTDNAMWLSEEALADKQNEAHALGWFSTPDPRHVMRHELGHLAHHKSIGKPYTSLESYQITPEEKAIAGTVSRYAMSDRHEFVAETFAGMMGGNTYSQEVMDQYERMGGPTVPKMPRTVNSTTQPKIAGQYDWFTPTPGKDAAMLPVRARGGAGAGAEEAIRSQAVSVLSMRTCSPYDKACVRREAKAQGFTELLKHIDATSPASWFTFVTDVSPTVAKIAQVPDQTPTITSANLGVTPYKGAGMQGINEVDSYYSSQEFAVWQTKLSTLTKENGVKVKKVIRATGIWEGTLEPSASVWLDGTPENIKTVARGLGADYNQDSVMLFDADDVTGEKGAEFMYSLVGIKDVQGAIDAMGKHGLLGGRVVKSNDGGHTLEIADLDGTSFDGIEALATELGVEKYFTPGSISFLYKGVDYEDKSKGAKVA